MDGEAVSDDGCEYKLEQKTLNIGWVTNSVGASRGEAEEWLREMRAKGWKVRTSRRPRPLDWKRVKL
jgi:hypothetical protein